MTPQAPASRALLIGFVIAGLAGCSALQAANTIRHNVENDKSVMESFTQNIKNSEAKPFEATYRTTGKSPTTVVYAVDPPTELSFRNVATGSAAADEDVDVIVNSTGEYACTHQSTARPTCELATGATKAEDRAIFGFYTPSHWVTFLHGFSLAAGLAGDSVTRSNRSVNGFAMSCVDFHAPGTPGRSMVCTTSQGILGLVKVAGDPTNFELTKYVATPPASDFALPPGAKIQKVVIPTATPTTSG